MQAHSRPYHWASIVGAVLKVALAIFCKCKSTAIEGIACHYYHYKDSMLFTLGKKGRVTFVFQCPQGLYPLVPVKQASLSDVTSALEHC